MATINLTPITIPSKSTLAPGKDAYNQEMAFGVVLDLLTLAKTNGLTYDDQALPNLNAKLDALNAKIDTLNDKLENIKNTALDPQGIIDAICMLAFQNFALELGNLTIRFMHNTLSVADV
jgi:hypothetical protein